MKKNTIFYIGCFIIGFGTAALGINMLDNITNFLAVVLIDVVWAFLLYNKLLFTKNEKRSI